MPIDLGLDVKQVPEGWLEIDARWVASVFGLTAVGGVRFDGFKIHVRVRHPALKPEQVVQGQLAQAIIPQGWSPTPGGLVGPGQDT